MKKKIKKSKRRVAPLTPEELDRLAQFLETTEGAMPMVQAHGLIAAMASTPSATLGPSAWLGKVHGDHEFASIEEAQELSLLITRLYNQIVDDLNKGYFNGPGELEDARLWCQGYLEGAGLDETWIGDGEGFSMMTPMGALAGELDDALGDDELADELLVEHLEGLPDTVLKIHEYWNDWRRKTLMPTLKGVRAPAPEKKQKVGRNEKCPCGSGKKYKKCCGKK